MNVRLANSQDLLPLELMYQSIVKQMEQEGLAIWDDVYPCICFPQDVKKQELYVIREGRTYISAFVLSEAHEGQEDIMWEYPQARAFYIDRFGVNVAVRAKGMGMYTLQEAVKEVKKKGEILCDYLLLRIIKKPSIYMRSLDFKELMVYIMK
ncbi:GNAT family N-acetyltransferase [[Eubacterium] hominis]|uniref:GNAT family N-acetyltransferase n=1 Tax=[Eubacterium] hominis TaxID=2764325 RepID=UPI003A4D63A6